MYRYTVALLFFSALSNKKTIAILWKYEKNIFIRYF